jgi:hypothetical protein
MTKATTVELDSYRLAQYAVQVPCYICDGANTFDAELCRHCYAPMALAQQAKNLKVKPRLLATIGSSGVGKTVYLGMLMDLLTRQNLDLQVLARGAFSINLQQTTMAALQRGEFPDKTPNEPDRWNWVHCQIRHRRSRSPVELVMPDMAGEALLEEVDHPRTYQVVRAFLTRCSGAVVLIDGSKIYSGTVDQDYFTMKLLSYLAELVEDPHQGWSNRPLAIVFSKADQCDEALDDPEGFAQRRAAGLWRYCQTRFRRHKFFAASVAGNCAFRESPYRGREPVPLRIEPRGLLEPFCWLIKELK